MNRLEDIERKLCEIKDFRMFVKTNCNVKDLGVVYADLHKIKDDILMTSLVEISDISNFDAMRFEVLEELNLVELDIREKIGLNTIKVKKNLNRLYYYN